MNNRAVTTLRVSPANERPFIVHVYTAKLEEKLKKYPGAVILGQTDTPAEGIIPTHVGKTEAELKAEKAAAKLASRNKQVAANRESTKAKRMAAKPVVPVKPTPAPKPVNPRAAKPIVNLSKGTYHPSRSAAERDNNTGENNIAYKLHKQHPTRIQGDIYDYATPDEERAGKCLRVVTDELTTLVDKPRVAKPMGPRTQRQYRAVVNLSTGAFYTSQSEADKAIGCFRDHVRRMFRRSGDTETVRVLGNVLSYATELEAKHRKCLRALVLTPKKQSKTHGGQMPIAFNQNR